MWALGFADPKLSVNQMQDEMEKLSVDQMQNPSSLIQPYVFSDKIKNNPKNMSSVLSMTR